MSAGDPMPAFSLRDQDGNPVRSDDLVGDGPVVIFFYPKDETAGCTAEACAFRDHYETFRDAGARVYGVSRDDDASHRQFRERHGLPFPLLTDQGGEVAKQFGVPRTLGLLPGRSTYIFDERGVLRHHFNSQFQAVKHVQEAKKVVEELAAGHDETPAP